MGLAAVTGRDDGAMVLVKIKISNCNPYELEGRTEFPGALVMGSK